MKRIFVLLVLMPLAFAQPPVNYTSYVATTGTVSLSSATTAATLQQPTDGSGTAVHFPAATNGGAPPVGASVQCSVACVATLARDGTAATTTAGTVVNINRNEPGASVKFFTASNGGGSGTTLAVQNIAAGGEWDIDLSAKVLANTNLGTTNLTISIASITGNVVISFYPQEQH